MGTSVTIKKRNKRIKFRSSKLGDIDPQESGEVIRISRDQKLKRSAIPCEEKLGFRRLAFNSIISLIK